jgi:hypothetical protein
MRMPGKKPEAGPTWEAMAAELNPRGAPYRLNELVFPPGEWVEVPAILAERMPFLGWAQVRQREVT